MTCGLPQAVSARGRGDCRKWRWRCVGRNSTMQHCAKHPRTRVQGARPATQNGFKQILLRRAVHACVADGFGLTEAYHGKHRTRPIDRVDGRLKVTGACALCSGIRRAGLRACGAGAKHDRRRRPSPVSICRRRRACPACSRSSRRTMRRSCQYARRRTTDRARAAAAGNATSSTTASMSRSWWPKRWIAPTPRRAVRVRYRRGEADHLDGCCARPGLRAEEFPQRRAAAGFQSRRSRRRFRRRAP